MADNSLGGKEISTSALAKELNKNPQEVFERLADMGLLVRNGKNWELTALGQGKERISMRRRGIF